VIINVGYVQSVESSNLISKEKDAIDLSNIGSKLNLDFYLYQGKIRRYRHKIIFEGAAQN